jgi:hypothetical protein
MHATIIQPNNRVVPYDMVPLFLCSKPHWHCRQLSGSCHFRRQAAGCVMMCRRHIEYTDCMCVFSVCNGAGSVWTSVQLAGVEEESSLRKRVRENAKTRRRQRPHIGGSNLSSISLFIFISKSSPSGCRILIITSHFNT